MGLRIVTFISLAVSHYQWSIASPMHQLPTPPDASTVIVIGSKSHPGIEMVPHDVPASSSAMLAGSHKPSSPPEVAFEGKPSAIDLAHYWIRNIYCENPELLCRENALNFKEQKAKYDDLSDHDRDALDDYIEEFVIQTDDQRKNSEILLWNLNRSSRSVWWDSSFIKNVSRKDQYRPLVAIGDLLLFNYEDANPANLPSEYIRDEVMNKLYQHLFHGSENLPLDVARLTEVKNKRGDSMYAKRVVEVIQSTLRHVTPDEEHMHELLVLYGALGFALSAAERFSKLAVKKIKENPSSIKLDLLTDYPSINKVLLSDKEKWT